MALGERVDPYLDFRFLVEIDSIIVGGFSEVSGLSVEVETDTYREGGVNDHERTIITGSGSPNLVLERGLTDSTSLWSWIDGVRHGDIERRSGRIFLLSSRGRPAWGWGFREAYPVDWSGPELHADQADVAIETLELTHRGLSVLDQVPVA